MTGVTTRAGATAALAAVLLTVAACGGDNHASGRSASTAGAETTAAASAAATAVVASTVPGSSTTAAVASHAGETITIGYVNDESGAIGAPEYRIGGDVAVDAINRAGGVAGAQIKLVHCAADGTPEGSINCANQFIEAKVDLVYAGIDVASDAFVPILKQAGIPYVSSNSWGPGQRDDDNSFMLHAAATAGSVAPLKFLKDEGVTKVALITQNTPVIQTFLDKIIRPIAEGKLGLQIDP